MNNIDRLEPKASLTATFIPYSAFLKNRKDFNLTSALKSTYEKYKLLNLRSL